MHIFSLHPGMCRDHLIKMFLLDETFLRSDEVTRNHKIQCVLVDHVMTDVNFFG